MLEDADLEKVKLDYGTDVRVLELVLNEQRHRTEERKANQGMAKIAWFGVGALPVLGVMMVLEWLLTLAGWPAFPELLPFIAAVLGGVAMHVAREKRAKAAGAEPASMGPTSQ